MSNPENLRALEVLMDEFFSPLTSNSRKAEIEKLLSNFSCQSSAWKDCLYFLMNTSNHYVCMFSLTTLENFIHRRWIGMLGTERAEIRSSLQQFLLTHHAEAPPFIRNKLVKLVVDMARSDWPHFYPDFLSVLLGLVRGQDTVHLGLTMLLTASEELGTPREDIATVRAAELRKLMSAQVPHLALTLTHTLESLLAPDTGLGAAGGDSRSRTPPPSPGSNASNDSEDSNSMDGLAGLGGSHTSAAVFTASPLHTGSLLHAASLKVLSASARVVKPPPRQGSPTHLDPRSTQVASLCLKCLAHIFTWADLKQVISPTLINVLFQYASLEIKSGGSDSDSTSLSVLAMSAINEIVYKNYVPADLHEYLVIMFRNSFQILQSLVMDLQSNAAKMRCLDPTYLEKITEFLRLFVSQHLRRCEDNSSFPLLEFLALMFKYSFQQTEVGGYFSCLEIWGCVVEYIQGTSELRKEVGSSILAKYQDALMSLVVELLKKVQWRYNYSQLAALEEQGGQTESGESELSYLTTTSIELVMKVGELLPQQVIQIVESAWKETSATYLGLEKLVTNGVLAIPEGEVGGVVGVLRDLATSLQCVGRLGSMFLGEHFLPRLEAGLWYMKQLLLLASVGSRLQLWCCCPSYSAASLPPALVSAHCHVVAALKAWCHWLAALHSEALQDSSYTWLAADLTSKIVASVVCVLKGGDAGGEQGLKHSAAHFLVTLTGTVRPPSIWKLKEFTDLYSSLHTLNIEGETRRLLVRALSNVLLLQWPGIQEQKWEDRLKHLSKFLRDITHEFRSIKDRQNFTNDRQLQLTAEPIIVHNLQVLGDLVENVLNEVTQTKKLCHDVLREFIDLSLWLFPIYLNSAKVCEEIFNFFYLVFDVLKTQMGSDFVEKAIQTFLSLFGQDQLSQAVLSKNTNESKVVEKFISILTFIVSEPGSAFQKFIPSTLSLCLDHIFPLINETSDLRSSLYSLLYATLLHNWNYFFKSSIVAQRALNNNGGGMEVVQNKEVFLSVMKMIGQSFLQSDIVIFKQNVEALESLNNKWRLYNRQIFKESLLAEFLTVFLRVLIAKSHNLLKEEIGVAVFHLGSTDLPVFYSKFIPGFLASTENLDDNQRGILATNFKAESDLPSFQVNLERLVTDLRYYQLVNSSISQGPVKF